MATTKQGRTSAPRSSIRTIWAIAKSPELSLEEADLYALIERETGKQHMSSLKGRSTKCVVCFSR